MADDGARSGIVISVGELNARARVLLEGSLALHWVAGEISNFTRAASGHCYFSLKDERAQVRCVFFRHRAQLVDWQIGNGIQVEVRATPTLYEPRGDFQLNVDFVRRAGLGALYEAYERLKRKLESEGLFAPERKRALPGWPRAVGIVTSPQAAALRDVLTTLRRRLPALPVVLYPSRVQGEEAPQQIVAAIERASGRGEVDVLIVCRGGGSIEDLWAFNDEDVARAIARCAIPVVSGVGHETDFTIADFVADARAPTPTAAAVLASPDGAALLHRLEVTGDQLRQATIRSLERRAQALDSASARLRHPGERIGLQLDRVAALAARLRRGAGIASERRRWQLDAMLRRIHAVRPAPGGTLNLVHALRDRLVAAQKTLHQRRLARLETMDSALRHLDPEGVLGRGYAIVRDAAGHVVVDAASLREGEDIRMKFAHGAAEGTIRSISPD